MPRLHYRLKWIIRVQDAMPADIQPRKYLLPFAAGTGREHEKQRIAIIIECGSVPAADTTAGPISPDLAMRGGTCAG